jgi:hypothetical protein
MSDERTDPQKAADDALEAALVLHEAAYRHPESQIRGSAIVTESVVIYAARGFDDAGEDVYVTVSHPSDSATPHGSLGLLESARLDFQANYYGWNEEDR